MAVRQWAPTEMPRMRRDMVDHLLGTLDRLGHPEVVAALRRKRVGQPGKVSGRPLTDRVFEAELANETHMIREAMRRCQEAELFWVTRDMTRVAMDASSDIPPWVPSAAVPAATGFLIWAEPLPSLAWYRDDDNADPPDVTTDAVQWQLANGYLDLDIYTRTDRLVEHQLLDEATRRGPFLKVRGHIQKAEEATSPHRTVISAEPGLLAAIGATWTLMQLPTVATPRRVTGAGGSGRDWSGQQRKVSIIDLRRLEHRDTSAADPAGRPYRHRWYVRGHWREQPYGPAHALRRPTWIPGYIKGPPGAPLLGLERVNVWRR